MGPESTSYREMESKDCNFNWLQLQLMHEGDRVGPKHGPWGTHSESEFLFNWIRNLLPLENYEIG